MSKTTHKYKRKAGVVPRNINWTEDSLVLALEELRQKKVSMKFLDHTEYPLEP